MCVIGRPRRPLLQQASESVQVGCEDRDTHGAFEAFPAMRAHPVQAMTLVVYKFRLLCSLMLGVTNKQLYYAIVQWVEENQ